ncbi:MAG TPA: SDR family NAD(P)-dependent oxidoreductase [Thermoanaerobaculia bacterium]|nr:SDR family NAD(P)-dependent oxidoreductase [Thermoanaerobaculia bacterium]
MADYRGKVAIVTGAASGIGAAIARRLASDGAAVCVSDLRQDATEKFASTLQGRTIAVAADVTSEDAIRDLVDRTVAELGRLDVLVSNAGIGEDAVAIDEKPAAAWHKVIETNLSSVFYGIKHAARVMKKAGRGGAIINIASILGSVGFAQAPAYVAAKHGVLGLTKAAALELAPARIRVVAVQPAFIRTPMITAEMESYVRPMHPIGRLGESDEVASLVSFLGSDEAAFITGAGYLIDGAYTAQ